MEALFNCKYGAFPAPPPSSDLLFPVALIKDFIVTDCSCEGFCNTVKAGQLAVVVVEGGGGFFLSLFLPGSSRQTDGRTGSSGTCPILSWPSALYD